MTFNNLIEEEAKRSFRFFYDEANTDPDSPGYGLILDKTGEDSKEVASIASVGFGLTALIIGIERNWITKEQGYERTKGTLITFRNNVEHVGGFFYHFLNMKTAKKYEHYHDCPSIIDTTLFLNGAITSAEYFGGEIAEIVDEIYERIDWTMYYDEDNNWFYMGYNEDTGGFGHWNMYAEQMTQYILGVASPTHPVPEKIYDGFEREKGSYGEYEFYNSPGGQLFTHQFSHAWFQFRGLKDKDGIDWYDNSVKATLAQKQYACDNPDGLKTLHEKSWGLTACEGPQGYCGPGAPPYHENVKVKNDGTVAPAAAGGSIVFTPGESIEALHYFYENHPKLWGKYGFNDAYNLDVNPEWYAKRVIGIDKGITLLMIENHRSGLVWELFMKNKHVKKGKDLLGFKKAEKVDFS
ncbi:glucoamylase family protein [Alteribacter aurantiacus]|uniref:glucoamylase family protein n=1 Tax=Alteribacter aurantiacus TaxID=254410 RepID=UPI000419ECE7|nr:glucoamylase family protein [Alteribacter aurantiacus]